MRKLYSTQTTCNSGCKYCFAKWNNLYLPQPKFETSKVNADCIIIYPSCDGEFFEQKELISYIKNLSSFCKEIIVSISTKRSLTDKEYEEIYELNKYLQKSKKGFIKFSVSVSTKTRISEIEPNTMSYSERMLTIKKLNSLGIPTSLTLKPILPFISTDEYIEIIDDFSKLTTHVLTGGLYLDPNTLFYKEYIKNRYVCQKRKVLWLDYQPEWLYCEDDKKLACIKEFASKLGLSVFDSDEDLVKTMIDKKV